MNKELVINTNEREVKIAMLEEGKLVELHTQESDNDYVVGDVFLGRVSKLLPGLNAAFVDIGHAKEAFIHYTDLGPKLPAVADYTKRVMDKTKKGASLDDVDISKEIVKNDKIVKVLKKRMPLMVQILKEPISTKGPRLTCEITLPGRFLVLIPFSNEISISKKIEDNDERTRMISLLSSIKPPNFGLIARTAAQGKTVAPLHEEILDLMEKWNAMFEGLRRQKPPTKLLSEEDKTKTFLRDIITPDFSRIASNNRQLVGNIRSYLKENIPELQNVVEHHRANRPIFQEYGVTKQIKTSFGKTYTLESGAYLVIEHTEAMHVIDVNSGPKMSKANRDDSALKVNLESAREIARQLRLRDIGGLIIIDFIDLKKQEHRQKLYAEMKDYMEGDRAQHTILPLSKFGLMQITRQRVRPQLEINTSEVCPTCKGTGKISTTLTLVDDIERDIKHILKSSPNTKLKLNVHPFLYAYLKRGLQNTQWKWYRSFRKWIKIIEDSSLPILDYRIFNANDEEIRLQ